MVFCLFSDKPPDKVGAKGAAGARNQALLDRQDNPNEFAVPLKSACCADPCTCCITTICAFGGCPACYFRKKVLDETANGTDDYVCCQGYVPKICCLDFPNMCQGSAVGLCCEGCCCPIFSLSIARIHLMDAHQLHPDPTDYQIIRFSNCCQILSCICDILACFDESFAQLAAIIDCIADTITASVAGCMGAQITVELKKAAESGPSAQTMSR